VTPATDQDGKPTDTPGPEGDVLVLHHKGPFEHGMSKCVQVFKGKKKQLGEVTEFENPHCNLTLYRYQSMKISDAKSATMTFAGSIEPSKLSPCSRWRRSLAFLM